MKTFITFLSLVFVFSSFTVEARTKHRKHSSHHSGRKSMSGKHAKYMNALGNKMPDASITKGQCDVKIDCPRGEILIDGKSQGKINCGPQTGWNFKGKKVKLTTTITPAGGRILPPGFPMLATQPMLCDNCFIHVYPWVQGRSLGCVGVTPPAWKKITQCGGSEIEFITKKGVRSEKPESVIAKKTEPPPAKPVRVYEADAEQAEAPSSGSF